MDADVQRLRDQMYELAEAIIDGHKSHKTETADPMSTLIDAEGREAIEERAAILEFDAKMSRDMADRVAVATYLSRQGYGGNGKEQR